VPDKRFMPRRPLPPDEIEPPQGMPTEILRALEELDEWASIGALHDVWRYVALRIRNRTRELLLEEYEQAPYHPDNHELFVAEVIDAIRRWYDAYGHPPRRREWNAVADPGYQWPRASTVDRHFGTWVEALRQAGFSPYGPLDHNATAKVELGRNRQMVTGGVADQKPQIFTR
jgi:hypothetical protein